MIAILYICGAYIIGAIPTGFLIARYAGIEDITQHGSGNIGATNVARYTHPFYFFLVLFLDICKTVGYLSIVTLPEQYFLAIFGAVALLVGNGISIFLRAKGGKGVAVALGIVYFFHKMLLLPCVAIWSFCVLLTGNIGIASVVGFVSLPCLAYYTVPDHEAFIMLYVFMSMWGIWRHKKNIKAFFSWTNVCA